MPKRNHSSIVMLLVVGILVNACTPVMTSSPTPLPPSPTVTFTSTQMPTATASVPANTPTFEPTPTQSAEQIEQSIMEQFVSGPLYDQYIADNQIPEQAATAFYNEYPGVDGESFAVVSMKVDPNSLSEEQKTLNIPQRDYLIVRTEDGQVEFKLLPVNLQLETFSKSAVEFTLSKEYQKGLQDYLNAMGLEAEAVVISQMVREVNEIRANLIVVDYRKTTLTSTQQESEELYANMPLFGFDENANKWGKMTLRRSAEMNALNIGVYVGSYGVPDNWEMRTDLQKKEFNAGLTIIDWPQIQTHLGLIEFPEGIRNDTNLASLQSMNQTYLHAIIWPLRMPNYLKSSPNDQVRNEVETYIRAVMNQYRTTGKNRVFNIVNEAYYPGDVLQQKFGNDYVTELFKLAAQLAQPGDILIYNDYNILPGSYSIKGSRTEIVMDILNRLQNDPLIQESGIQIGLGIQAHLYGDNKMRPDEYAQIFDAFGVPVIITETSVIMTYESGSDRLKKQADVYSRLIAGIKQSKNCNTIYIFGTDDYTSWFERSIGELEGASKNADPLLFDDHLNPKPAYYAVLSTLMRQGTW